MRIPNIVNQVPVVEGRRIDVRGGVQGSWFQPWLARLARDAEITGRARTAIGRISVDAFGSGVALDSFIERLSGQAPAAAGIEEIHTHDIPFERLQGFEILDLDGRPSSPSAIPSDLATCPECLEEMRDPSRRRFGYPFTSCEACGPRFATATAVPCDRPHTTLTGFAICAECAREVEDEAGSRHGADTVTCPVCGPAIRLLDEHGQLTLAAEPLVAAAAALGDGLIVAIKGTSGFHLACDAASPVAVERLRERKGSDERPFPVMVRDIEAAHAIAVLTSAEERLLTSPERPIVLVPRRSRSPLAAAVAPGDPIIGLMLPHDSLHHLLADAVRRPLVMAPGGAAGEPVVAATDEALRRLRDVADRFLVHDWDIVTRSEPSVVRVIASAPVVLRRSRGYVPQAIELGSPVGRPVLACGGLRENTFCFVRGREAVLGPHIGDLDRVEAVRVYREHLERLERFLGIEPDIVAHDLHPDFVSTRYAVNRPGAVPIGVQHHHAHVASLMAEHGLDGPVIGVAYDGGGMGSDGASWGGEILIADYRQFQRAATFRPMTLAGGDVAIRQPWRLALAVLEDAFDGDAPLEALPLFADIPRADIDAARQMLRQPRQAWVAHGAGRYFEAMGALGLGRSRSGFDGHVAGAWAACSLDGERGRYRYEVVRRVSPWQLDLRPTVRDAVFELIGGEAPGRVSARFHNTIAAATADLVRGVARMSGRLPVGLTGGCFRNARLTESILRELRPDFAVHAHARVPPGDGGLALGQAVVADALAGRV